MAQRTVPEDTMILQSCWSALMSIPKPKHENIGDRDGARTGSGVFNHASQNCYWTRQFTNLNQEDLQSLNASQATKGTFEEPGSFSMVEALLNLLPSHLRIASDLALESSLEHVKANYDVIASYTSSGTGLVTQVDEAAVAKTSKVILVCFLRAIKDWDLQFCS